MRVMNRLLSTKLFPSQSRKRIRVSCTHCSDSNHLTGYIAEEEEHPVTRTPLPRARPPHPIFTELRARTKQSNPEPDPIDVDALGEENKGEGKE